MSGAAVVGVVGLMAPVASAAPVKAKTALSGTFTDCSNGTSGTFVVNSGKSQATNWAAAHLTFTGGGKGIFTTTARDLTITSGGQTVGTEKVSKHAKKNPVTCTIHGTVGDFTVDGTVTGKMVIKKLNDCARAPAATAALAAGLPRGSERKR